MGEEGWVGGELASTESELRDPEGRQKEVQCREMGEGSMAQECRKLPRN